MNNYDARQTAMCNQLRTFLQSIAVQAVEAQEQLGTDRGIELLDDIQDDVKRAVEMMGKLNRNEVL